MSAGQRCIGQGSYFPEIRATVLPGPTTLTKKPGQWTSGQMPTETVVVLPTCTSGLCDVVVLPTMLPFAKIRCRD